MVKMEIMKTRKYLRVNWTNQKPMVKWKITNLHNHGSTDSPQPLYLKANALQQQN